MIEYHPNQRIRAHLQWVSGKTNSNKKIIIGFLDENEDLIDIAVIMILTLLEVIKVQVVNYQVGL